MGIVTNIYELAVYLDVYSLRFVVFIVEIHCGCYALKITAALEGVLQNGTHWT